MIDMMVLRQLYALVILHSNARKPCQGRGHPREFVVKKGKLTELERWVAAQKGMTGFPEGLCSREGNVGEWIFLGIIISRWNRMHIGSAPWNNESVAYQ